ncbi:hypothetical protein A3770_03p24400 [Chloropicon primus]|uniref:Uncharacterized protein n=1 Tax=Chloropicon primus TaxID=1764295 RepID=A0A5B8MKM5_9CHLO|nr:hypothetical protein A3770_03p24400 [Chloropicon primus]|eukprot:QDZ19922.1 hypothetical protein A3770_03p24400 [Chloropicon primus]
MKFWKWLEVRGERDEEVERQAQGALYLLDELLSKNPEVKGGVEHFSVGDPLYDAYVPILSFYLGPEVTKALLMAHKDGKHNVYKRDHIACWLIAGLGYNRCDKTDGLRKGIKKLEGQIDRGKVQPMPVLGRLLKVHNLKPLPLRVRKGVEREGGGDDPEGTKFSALLYKLLREKEEKDGKETKAPTDVGMKLVREWAHEETMIQDEERSARREGAAREYCAMTTKELHEMFVSMWEHFRSAKHGRIDFSRARDERLKEMRALVEELKIRLMDLEGAWGGWPLVRATASGAAQYIPTLTMNVGPEAAFDFLNANSPLTMTGNIYKNSLAMAMWLIGLGYERDTSKTMSESYGELKQNLDAGTVEPLKEMVRLLEDRDLPWPPAYFQSLKVEERDGKRVLVVN